MRQAAPRRLVVVLIALLALFAAPQAAFAERDDPWSVWAREVTQRSRYEVPLAVLVSIPCMLLITPFWLGQLAYDQVAGGDD